MRIFGVLFGFYLFFHPHVFRFLLLVSRTFTYFYTSATFPSNLHFFCIFLLNYIFLPFFTPFLFLFTFHYIKQSQITLHHFFTSNNNFLTNLPTKSDHFFLFVSFLVFSNLHYFNRKFKFNSYGRIFNRSLIIVFLSCSYFVLILYSKPTILNFTN